MKKLLLLAAVLVIGGIGVIGCGGKEESKESPPTGATSAGKMSGTDDKMKGSDDKMTTSDPTLDKIKTALADPKFKDVVPKHEDGKVKLTGSVADNDTKKAAEKAVKDGGVTEPVMNMLTVEKH